MFTGNMILQLIFLMWRLWIPSPNIQAWGHITHLMLRQQRGKQTRQDYFQCGVHNAVFIPFVVEETRRLGLAARNWFESMIADTHKKAGNAFISRISGSIARYNSKMITGSRSLFRILPPGGIPVKRDAGSVQAGHRLKTQIAKQNKGMQTNNCLIKIQLEEELSWSAGGMVWIYILLFIPNKGRYLGISSGVYE